MLIRRVRRKCDGSTCTGSLGFRVRVTLHQQDLTPGLGLQRGCELSTRVASRDVENATANSEQSWNASITVADGGGKD